MQSNSLICVIDDNPDYTLILQHFFSTSLPEYTVRYFDNGKTFLSELSQMPAKPKLILLDRHMPIVDGHQLLIHLKWDEYVRMIPVVMMSAEATSEEISGCYEAGANSFIIKAIDFNQLRKTLTVICQYWIEFNTLPRHT